MSKAFELFFPYIPKWKKNDERDKEEQIVITLADMSQLDRLEHLNRITQTVPTETPSTGPSEKEIASATLSNDMQLARKSLEIAVDVSKKYFRGVVNLTVKYHGAEPVEVKDIEGIQKHAPDLLTEIAARLIHGPTEEEGKD